MHTVLHVSLEYQYGIGGLKTVMNGLLPALEENGVNISVITPYYDFIQHNPGFKLEQLATINHLYKKILHTSLIFRVENSKIQNITTIQHYLIKPNINSPVEQIFNVGNAQNIYKAFNESEPQNRLEYFNGAISSFIRISTPNIPSFDIVHTHTWHTSLSICLIKEFEQLNWIKSNSNLQLKSIPKIISTVHLLSNEQGLLVGKREIVDTLQSVGLPLDSKFLMDHKHLNQMYLGLQYADQVTMVSKSVANDALTGKDFGLGLIFNTLHRNERFQGITNGIVTREYDATMPGNLEDYAITTNTPSSIVDSRQKIKNFLSAKYVQLNSSEDTMWFLYIGRFGQEKGIDMLPHALDAISSFRGNLIVMGCYVSSNTQDPILEIINSLKLKKNVVVIDTKQEQDLVGKYFRAACEFTIVPSHKEACGCIPMESMTNFSIPITSDVQGLPDTILSLIDNPENGTGFMYHDDNIDGPENLKQTITTAYDKYIAWRKEQTVNLLLSRLHKNAAKFDWKGTPVKYYLQLYDKILKTATSSTPHIVLEFPIIKVLHVALEYKNATLGGLGTVTTQLVNAQNKFKSGTKFESSIITPYYSKLFTNDAAINCVASVVHIYNNEEVESLIYLTTDDQNKHFLVKPSFKYRKLFDIDTACQIYTAYTDFIERLKYFNSAVASFISTSEIVQPAIIQLHGWHTTLSAVLLKEIYKFNSVKIVYTVHINNKDRGTYSNSKLAGIGLQLPDKFYTLKKMGVDYSDYTIAVSPSILTECSTSNSQIAESLEMKQLQRSFCNAKYTKTSVGILNGIDYKKYCPLGKLIHNSLDIVADKNAIKQQLATTLPGRCSAWKIDPTLPVILYIGRFSPEKGVECFKNAITAINQRAIFFAIGKGLTDEVFRLIMEDSRQKDNVFITFSQKEQRQYGDLMRACADFIFMPSHDEACGLTSIEGFACGSICITSGVGGLKDFIVPFHYNEVDWVGNGFFYKDQDQASLEKTINFALNIWKQIPVCTKNIIHNRIMEEGKQFDWLADNGSVQKYWEVFKNILAFQEPKTGPRLMI